MNECAFKKLKREARERELERKVEAFKRKKVERERAEQVKLIGTIYVESLVSHALLIEETIIFEQKHKSRELKEELKAYPRFLRVTTTFRVAPTP
jgi:hypothetical protein